MKSKGVTTQMKVLDEYILMVLFRIVRGLNTTTNKPSFDRPQEYPAINTVVYIYCCRVVKHINIAILKENNNNNKEMDSVAWRHKHVWICWQLKQVSVICTDDFYAPSPRSVKIQVTARQDLHLGRGETDIYWQYSRSFDCYIIATMLEDDNKRFFAILSLSIDSLGTDCKPILMGICRFLAFSVWVQIISNFTPGKGRKFHTNHKTWTFIQSEIRVYELELSFKTIKSWNLCNL